MSALSPANDPAAVRNSIPMNRGGDDSAPESEQPTGPMIGRDQSKKKYAVSVRWESEQEQGTKGQTCCTGTTEDFHSSFCCCARRVGGMFFLCERSDGSPCVVAGPCWPFCMFVTVPLILGLSGLTAYFVILRKDAAMPKWFAYIYLPVVAITLMTLFGVSCRNPGLLERVTDEEAANGGWYWNEQVGSFRPPDSLYCRECKAIIQEYDHLCPWTGTGIGKGNMFCFKCFVLCVNVLCYFSIAIVAYVLIRGGN